jgi:orotate phosphoribosyltransferase
MKEFEKNIAGLLLQCKAIKLSPRHPFQWASGWLSPIYCDNRKTLAYPDIRNQIKYTFADLIKEIYFSTEAIAGVATGAIAQGALVADVLGLPFMYVRSEAKGHGLSNLIEGYPKPGEKVVVVEDLVSTGGSSLKAVEALRNAGCMVLGMVAIFSYGFPQAEKNFQRADCTLHTLSNYETMLQLALESGYINQEELSILQLWRQDPENWGRHIPNQSEK